MTVLPNKIEIDDREYAAAEVIQVVLEATAREIAGCMDAIQARRELATVENEPLNFSSGLAEAILVLRKRAQDIGIPHLVEEQVTSPLDVSGRSPNGSS